MAMIVISDPTYFNDEATLINQLFKAGMPVFHLRKPGTDLPAYQQLIAQIDSHYHDKIALHQFHELVQNFPLIKRLHYPEILRSGGISTLQNFTFSTSIHKIEDLKDLTGFNYTFYGPVYNSISKPGYSGLSKSELVLPDEKRPTKVIALGGINQEQIPELKKMGFDGFAVLGAIWADKKESIKTMKSLIDKNLKHFC